MLQHWGQSQPKEKPIFIAGHDLLQLEYAFDTCRYQSRCITRRSFKKFNDAAFLDSFRTGLPDLGVLSYSDGVCCDGADTLLETTLPLIGWL